MSSSTWEFDCPQVTDFENLHNDFSDNELDNWFECHEDNRVTKTPRMNRKSAIPVSMESNKSRTPRRSSTKMSSTSSKDKTSRKTPTPMSPSLKLKKRLQNNEKKITSSTKQKLTLPTTPQVLKRTLLQYQTNDKKSKSNKEVEKLNGFQKKMRMSQGNNTAVRAQPIKSVSYSTTVPHEFNFATDARLKTHLMKTRLDEPKDFVASLRNNNSINDQKPKPRVTKPVPFRFKTDSVMRKKGDKSKCDKNYKTAAQIVEEFQRKTPMRFHNHSNNGPKPVEHIEKHITQPHTPKLRVLTRKRKADVIGYEKLEEIEANEMKKYQFKANPVNERIMKFPTGIKKINKSSPTKFAPFSFESDKLIHKKKPDETEKYEFRAKPVPAKVLSGPSHLGPVVKFPLTNPHSPAFCLRDRAQRKRKANTPKPDTPKPIRIHTVPHQGIPFMPKLDKKTTSVKPFTFDVRDKKMLEKKEEKIKEEIELMTKVPKFKAQLLPPESPSGIPNRKKIPATKPEPFHLLIDDRGEEKIEKWKKQCNENIRKEQEAKEFKAQTCDIIYKKPFAVKPSSRALTNISSFELNTDRRAVERYEIAQHKEVRKSEIESIMAERKKIQEREELEEIRRMRKETVHKAQPVKKAKPFIIHPSELELTLPSSPRFSARLKANRS